MLRENGGLQNRKAQVKTLQGVPNTKNVLKSVALVGGREMVKPKRVLIAGQEWKVQWDKRSVDGGSFDTYDAKIVIGDNGHGGDLETYLHEVLEAILHNRQLRYHIYCDRDNEKKLFSMDHAQFVNVIQDLAAALRPIIKGE